MENSGLFRKTHGARLRWFWIFVGVLLVALVGFFVFVPLTTKEKKRSAGPPKTKEEAIQLVMRDSDNDGLKDWEEKIYGTDPEKIDTDKDGTPDGEEIKEGRNPLQPGRKLPDGAWSDILSVALAPPEDNNKTQALANELINNSLTKVIAESVAGSKPATDLLANPGLQSYVEKLGKTSLFDKVIRPEEREFIIQGDNSPEAVKTYFNRVIEIHVDNFSKIDSDLSILYLAATGSNPKAFRRLDANIAAIEKAIQETRGVPVPTQWLEFAKKYIWYLSKTLTAVKILRNSENDPVSSLLVLNDRVQLIDDFRNLYLDTKIKLAAAGIAFHSREPAFLITQQK